MPEIAHQRGGEKVWVVIPTHTPRHLDIVLAGLGRQTMRPAAIVVSCDTDDESIGEVIARSCARFGLQDVWWLRRAHMGGERLCQVRNNAVRFLLDELSADEGRVLVLDGDMLASDELVAQHGATGAGTELVYAYRVNVSKERTEALEAERVFAGEQRLELEDGDVRELARRDLRARRHLLMRRLGVGAKHKPKLLGGQFSCDLELYHELNGFDELYQGWGFKDDEFAYRAARLGARVRIGIREMVAWHLWHPTRQPGVAMRELPTAQRFAERGRLPLVAEHGLRTPLEQAELRVDRVG